MGGLFRGKRVAASAEWFGRGGGLYCQGCHEQELPCAGGDGTCPFDANRPLTTEGVAGLRIATAQGAFIRAGMGGEVCGVDIAGAMLRMDMTGLDEPLARELAHQGELGLLKGIQESGKDKDGT